MSHEKIYAICKICPSEHTNCDMDDPTCWIVKNDFCVSALEAELEFMHRTYGKEMNENLTNDALCLKIAVLEAENKQINERLHEAESTISHLCDFIMTQNLGKASMDNLKHLIENHEDISMFMQRVEKALRGGEKEEAEKR